VKKGLIPFLFLLLLLLSGRSLATHNRAGEITYRQISDLTYEITLTTFTDVSAPNNADRPRAILSFGDNTSADSPRIEKTVITGTFIQRNKYRFIHTYPGYATYLISYEDPNRNEGVSNMKASVNTPFYIETQLVINPFIGFNNSPTLLLEPIDFGAVNKLFVHNPNAFDIDGDSLSFKLVPCKQSIDEEVFEYLFPTRANDFATDTFYVENETGQIVWENPKYVCVVNIAIRIEEWRYIPAQKRYVQIGYIVRDMQVEIKPSDNTPPVIQPMNDTCIIAGTTLIKEVRADDVDGDMITLTATGGPFKLPPPDTIIFPQPKLGVDSVKQTFTWKTSCNAVRKQPYQVVFKAVDNGGNPNLTDLQPWRITIVAPAPKDFAASSVGTTVDLSWTPVNCSKAVGYKIYRRLNSYNFIPANCETGIPEYTGYTLLTTINTITTSTFSDNDNGRGLKIGNTYCYRIITFYPDQAESYTSSEVCISLKRDVPWITNVDVISTNVANGIDSIRWTKPVKLDTIQFPGPYQYQLYRSSTSNPNYSLIHSSSSPFLGTLNDTVYRDENINTVDDQHTYRVSILANGILIGSAFPATSIYLRATPLDNRVVLSWDIDVSWKNDTFEIYRQNQVTSLYEKVGFALDTNKYTDDLLTNGVTYSYYVRSIGEYASGDFPKPLLNRSQIIFTTPIDLEKPCPPVLSITPMCDLYQNELKWNYSDDSCAEDVIKYHIYKSFFEGEEFTFLTEVSPKTAGDYIDNNLTKSIAGCYFITAIDSFNNESERSNVICVDNCPEFVLPNAFTPNDDGINDLLVPIKDSVNFIDEVNIKIFSRWGKLIYETTDPNVNWDGKDQDTGQKLDPGVYFYICEFSEIRVQGLKPKNITGFVHLIR
jgi:gliding motility-associated-like protein